MPAAVHNLKLKELSASSLRLRIVDAAQCPVDVSSWAFEASLRQIESQELSALLKVNLDNPSAGEISIAIPPRERSMVGWLLSASPQGEELKPLCHGVATFAPYVSPKAPNNPETHRLILSMADPVRVSVDSVDLAFWAASQAQKAATQTQTLADSHFNESEIHTSAEEKEAWNAKLSPADADARYGLAGTLPGQEVNGQSFSTNLYFTGNRLFAKSVDFDTADVKNPVLELNVDDKSVRFFDSYIESYGIAFFHTLYTSKLSVEGVITGTFSGTHWGSFSGNHYGECMLFSNIVEDFEAPGWRHDKTNSCVDFKGVLYPQGKPVVTAPMSIHYGLDKQKVAVANLEVKGQTVLNPSSEDDEVLLTTFKANDAARYELRLRKSDGALRLTLPGGGSSIFSCNGSGKMFALRGFDVKGDFTAQSATFSGDVTVNGDLSAPSGVITGYGVIAEIANVGGVSLTRGNDNRGSMALSLAGSIVTTKNIDARTGIYALPLGKKTALGADAYGLSVSADGGLQLWGTHFMQGSIWGENGLKMVQNEVSLTSTDSAAIGFDYANTVDFRTMPNDGVGHGVYRFQCWHWTDDSHTAIEEGAVDVRKKAAMQPTDESLLNRSENDSRYGRLAEANEWSGVQTIYAPDGKYGANKIIQIRDASGEYPGYNICFRNGGSLEIFDESQDPTAHEPYFQIYRPFGQRTYACQNFCVKGTTELRKAVTLTSTSSLTANCPATFKGAVTFTQAPVLPGMFAGDANSVSNAYSALGLALLSPMWVQTAYFNKVTVKAGTANSVSKTVGVRGLVHWASGNATVSETGFIQPSAESNVYGGLEGFWQPIHFYTNEGWVKVSFGVNAAKLTSAEYTVSDFALNEKDVFVYAPTAVQSDSFNGYVDITFMWTSSTKTTVRTRFLKKASNSSTWYLEEQVAEIPLVLTGWGNSMQGFGGARNAEKNKVLFFVHHGPAIYKVAEFESPWLVINDSKVNFALSAGDLGASDYSYTTIENQRIYMRADLFGGEFACPFFEVLNNCAQNVITTITEPVIYEPVSSDVE